MEIRLHWIGALSFAASVAAFASPGAAQSPRPWVDPPSEAGTTAPSPAPPHATHEVKPAPSQSSAAPAASTPSPKAEVQSAEKAQQKSDPSASPGQRKAAAKSSPQKVVKESRDRKPARDVTTAQTQRPRPVPQRRDVAEQPAGDTRADRVRAGIDSGLEVMNLRTIELPDGRRIQILTRPRPGAMSELLNQGE